MEGPHPAAVAGAGGRNAPPSPDLRSPCCGRSCACLSQLLPGGLSSSTTTRWSCRTRPSDPCDGLVVRPRAGHSVPAQAQLCAQLDDGPRALWLSPREPADPPGHQRPGPAARPHTDGTVVTDGVVAPCLLPSSLPFTRSRRRRSPTSQAGRPPLWPSSTLQALSPISMVASKGARFSFMLFPLSSSCWPSPSRKRPPPCQRPFCSGRSHGVTGRFACVRPWHPRRPIWGSSLRPLRPSSQFRDTGFSSSTALGSGAFTKTSCPRSTASSCCNRTTCSPGISTSTLTCRR